MHYLVHMNPVPFISVTHEPHTVHYLEHVVVPLYCLCLHDDRPTLRLASRGHHQTLVGLAVVASLQVTL